MGVDTFGVVRAGAGSFSTMEDGIISWKDFGLVL